MSNARRNGWIAIIAVVAVLALFSAGWQVMRSRPAATASGPATGSPASLPAPTSAPRPTGTGTAKLSWSAIDPAALQHDAADPIAGFRVYVGPAPDALQLEATIDDPAATGHVVEQLPKGTFYYSVSTYTRLGIESLPATPVAKTIE